MCFSVWYNRKKTLPPTNYSSHTINHEADQDFRSNYQIIGNISNRETC